MAEIPRSPKLLDCFCGMGGVSDGFALEGFDVTGIDIVDAPKMLGYKHRFIQADMLSLKGEDFKGFDVIWGSPPCREFSNFAIFAKERIKRNQRGQWKKPPNLEEGLGLVKHFLKFVEDAKPFFWVLENVDGLAEHLSIKPRAIGAKIKGGKRHVFYGNFLSILIPQTTSKPMAKYQGGNISWERAKIPLACSRAFARACYEAIYP